MKRTIMIIMAVVVMVCTLTACRNNESDVNDPNVITNAGTLAEFTANTYLIDSWREDGENGDRTYYITLLMFSEDYYDRPTIDDVRYLTDEGYMPFTEVIEDSSIVIYHAYDNLKDGICSYAKITTKKLIDTKKMYVKLEGSSEYQENISTKEEYKESYGSLDGWHSVITNLSSKTPPYDKIATIQTSLYSGVIRLYNDNKSQYYYESVDQDPIVENDSMLTKIFVDKLKGDGLENLRDELINGNVANIIDGRIEVVTLDERLTIACELIDDELWVGFKTVDGSDFSEYDGEIPDAITYEYEKISYFLIKHN